MRLAFTKGHGTGNDFVVLPDLDDHLDLTPQLVRALCDRRSGLGADGVLRVVRADGGWFMDYRNADGSVGEMCGNGVRVFARYLLAAGLVDPGVLPVVTRAGLRAVTVTGSGDVTVDMGPPELLDVGQRVDGRAGRSVSMGNPHVVVRLDGAADLAALDLREPPAVTPGLPGGQNVEFVVRAPGEMRLVMRVHERGVGETRSCGTGVCAAVVAIAAADGDRRGLMWTVEVPGGRLHVMWTEKGTVTLRGPAMLVASGEIDLAALGYPAAVTASGAS